MKGRVYKGFALLALKTEITISPSTFRRANKVGSIGDGVCRGELVHRSSAEPLRNICLNACNGPIQGLVPSSSTARVTGADPLVTQVPECFRETEFSDQYLSFFSWDAFACRVQNPEYKSIIELLALQKSIHWDLTSKTASWDVSLCSLRYQ
jgi:hypothetical protein